MSHTATCEHDEHLHEDDRHLHDEEADEPRVGSAPQPRRSTGGLLATSEARWATAATVAFAAALVLRAAGAGGSPADACFVACYAAGGWDPARSGVEALLHRTLDVDLLMVVAALVAAAIGQVTDGALLIVIFSTSGALEALSTRRTRDALRSLLALSPDRASRVGPDGAERLVDATELAPGDVIVVRPGERIGADGRVVAGSSDVDQASISGEPLPVARTVGDEVFAGTLNGAGALRIRVGRPAEESVVARIASLVEVASETKARTQLWIEGVEQRYSVAMVTVTVALLVVPMLAGSALKPTLLRAMTFMIVASPCAVVLATMPPLLAAVASAGRRGVLVKSAVAMEQLGRADLIAFDKTGTLTKGSPRVDRVHALGAAVDAGRVLAWAAAAEQPSEHPLGRAIVEAGRAAGPVPEATEFRSQPGVGVGATVDGRRITVGRAADGADDAIAGLKSGGRTVVVVASDGEPVGLIALADTVRAGAAGAVAALAGLCGRTPLLLTGDQAGAARAVATAVGIADVRAALLPEDKAAAVAALRAAGHRVAVVGDGVNDAPALATADVGVAMGRHGSDLALETADVVMVRDELGAVPAAVRLSRRARRVVSANLVFAGVVIVTLAAVDLAGHLPLPLGVAGHEGSSVVVALNGLRLLRPRYWEPSGG